MVCIACIHCIHVYIAVLHCRIEPVLQQRVDDAHAFLVGVLVQPELDAVDGLLLVDLAQHEHCKRIMTLFISEYDYCTTFWVWLLYYSVPRERSAGVLKFKYARNGSNLRLTHSHCQLVGHVLEERLDVLGIGESVEDGVQLEANLALVRAVRLAEDAPDEVDCAKGVLVCLGHK